MEDITEENTLDLSNKNNSLLEIKLLNECVGAFINIANASQNYGDSLVIREVCKDFTKATKSISSDKDKNQCCIF